MLGLRRRSNLGIIFPKVHSVQGTTGLCQRIRGDKGFDMSEQIMRENLLVLVQTYATANNWALATVSKQIHGNQTFLENYAAGTVSTTVKTYFLMIDRLREKWPAGVDWPITREVPRPARIPYRPLMNPPPRDDTGKFLGKKVSKKTARAL